MSGTKSAAGGPPSSPPAPAGGAAASPSAVSKVVCASIAFAMGAWAFVKTQQLSGPMFEPIVKLCSSGSMEELVEAGYHPYEPAVGFGFMGSFVCIVTQFLHSLRTEFPGGLLTWGAVVVVAQPAAAICTIEAGRAGSWGPIRYPMVFGLLYQVLGISVIFPALWVPFYCLGRGTGAVSPARAYGSIIMTIPALVLSVLVFVLDVDSSAWTVSAGILAGPGLVLTGVFLWAIKDPDLTAGKDAIRRGAMATAKTCAILGIISLVGWYYLVWVVASHYGIDYASLWSDIWTNAPPAVAFMTIDSGILWLGVVVYIAVHDWKAAAESLLLTPFFGPGASCSYALMTKELEVWLDKQPRVKSE